MEQKALEESPTQPSHRMDISRNRNFLNIVERAYLADPERTENDLLSLGLRDLVSNLKNDHRSGRLRETVEGVKGFPPSFEPRTR